MNCKRYSNVERYTLHGVEGHPEMKYRLRGDYRTGCPEGGDHAGGVVDIRNTCGLCIWGI